MKDFLRLIVWFNLALLGVGVTAVFIREVARHAPHSHSTRFARSDNCNQ